jgi:hypothetical protein
VICHLVRKSRFNQQIAPRAGAGPRRRPEEIRDIAFDVMIDPELAAMSNGMVLRACEP